MALMYAGFAEKMC